ncbi:hypothetical protein NPIL_537071 [Nephila pilipes]|uniref:Uncharacterized protein n=1 Tax=Nephila pilipes TaxID=299642 RepID=A0A8X6U5Z4_NEPPI|nr:hypothetical protein NPIL_537071 [Nephila pilipes]
MNTVLAPFRPLLTNEFSPASSRVFRAVLVKAPLKHYPSTNQASQKGRVVSMEWEDRVLHFRWQLSVRQVSSSQMEYLLEVDTFDEE